MTMTKSDPEREERRRQQAEIAESLKASSALDDIFARIDAGEPLTGHAGPLKGMLKASLERGLEAELTDHVGYDRGDPDAALFPNSRNGFFPKTVTTEIGDVELAVPRDRGGTFTPMLVPKGVRLCRPARASAGRLRVRVVITVRRRVAQALRSCDSNRRSATTVSTSPTATRTARPPADSPSWSWLSPTDQ